MNGGPSRTVICQFVLPQTPLYWLHEKSMLGVEAIGKQTYAVIPDSEELTQLRDATNKDGQARHAV